MMNNDISSELRKVFSPLLESQLLQEIEEKSILFNATAGQGLIRMGQSISVVPMILNGTLKVSRENEEGQELVLYYVKPGEGCAMTFSCGLMSQPSQVKGTAEDDLRLAPLELQVVVAGRLQPGPDLRIGQPRLGAIAHLVEAALHPASRPSDGMMVRPDLRNIHARTPAKARVGILSYCADCTFVVFRAFGPLCRSSPDGI